MANTFHQLNAANNSGDYLTLKKAKSFQRAKFNNKMQNNFENNLLTSKGNIVNFKNLQDTCATHKAHKGVFQQHLRLAADAPAGLAGEYITFLGSHKHLATRKIDTYDVGSKDVTLLPPLNNGATDNTTQYIIGRPLTYPYSKITIDDDLNKLSF